jgi:hypothetical protein
MNLSSKRYSKLALFAVLLCVSKWTKAQTFFGLQNSNYAGVNAIYTNPALVTNMNHQRSANIGGLGVNIDNNYVSLETPFSFWALVNNDVDDKYKDQNGVLTLQKSNSIGALTVSDLAETNSDEQKIFTLVEVESGYVGGLGAWRQYLQNNLNTDVPGANGAPKGKYTVVVRFIVAKDGTISNVVAETKHGFGMEKESVRVIINSGKWTPAIYKGRNVNSYKRQPITWVVSE